MINENVTFYDTKSQLNGRLNYNNMLVLSISVHKKFHCTLCEVHDYCYKILIMDQKLPINPKRNLLFIHLVITHRHLKLLKIPSTMSKEQLLGV